MRLCCANEIPTSTQRVTTVKAFHGGVNEKERDQCHEERVGDLGVDARAAPEFREASFTSEGKLKEVVIVESGIG
jgi:hypothetical protein